MTGSGRSLVVVRRGEELGRLLPERQTLDRLDLDLGQPAAAAAAAARLSIQLRPAAAVDCFLAAVVAVAPIPYRLAGMLRQTVTLNLYTAPLNTLPTGPACRVIAASATRAYPGDYKKIYTLPKLSFVQWYNNNNHPFTAMQ